MMSKYEYKEALGRLDKDTRICFKYLEKLINDKFNTVLGAQHFPAPQVNLSKFESQLDSFRKQLVDLLQDAGIEVRGKTLREVKIA